MQIDIRFASINLQRKFKENSTSHFIQRIHYQLAIMCKMKNKIIDLNFDNFFQKHTYKRTRDNAFNLLIPKSKIKYC